MVIVLKYIIPLLLQLTINGKVVYVSDGDTIHVIPKGGEKIKVRVEGIDCPEITQEFGLEAKAFVVDAILHKQVKIMVVDVDRYGRKVARVYYGQKDLSVELLKNGLAWHYKKYNQETELAALESDARKRKAGLWSNHFVAPWDYRKGGNNVQSGDLKPGQVLICNSSGSKSYHLNYCQGLRRCQSEVLKLTKQLAIKEGRSPCGYCY